MCSSTCRVAVTDDLEVKTTGATIIARQVWGALRGLETFSQLLYQDDQGRVSVDCQRVGGQVDR